MDKEESKKLTERLDKLCADADTSVITNIQDYQRDHLAYMGQHYSRFMNQFEMYFSALVDAGLNINYLDKKHWPDHRAIQFTVASHALKQFYSAYILLYNGFYDDALTVLRSVYESFLRIIFASLYQKEAHNIYDHHSKDQKGRKFNATQLVQDLGLDWNIYLVMSFFAHSNQYKVVETLAQIAQKEQKGAITLAYEKDDDMISAVTNNMLFLLVAFLKMFTELFTVNYSDHKDKAAIQEHVDLLNEYKDAASQTLKLHDANEFWRKVGYDVDNIFTLINYMDQNPDVEWKVRWKTIVK